MEVWVVYYFNRIFRFWVFTFPHQILIYFRTFQVVLDPFRGYQKRQILPYEIRQKSHWILEESKNHEYQKGIWELDVTLEPYIDREGDGFQHLRQDPQTRDYTDAHLKSLGQDGKLIFSFDFYHFQKFLRPTIYFDDLDIRKAFSGQIHPYILLFGVILLYSLRNCTQFIIYPHSNQNSRKACQKCPTEFLEQNDDAKYQNYGNCGHLWEQKCQRV